MYTVEGTGVREETGVTEGTEVIEGTVGEVIGVIDLTEMINIKGKISPPPVYTVEGKGV